MPAKKVEILLIKANICGLLDARLQSDGFNVINRGVVVPFPAFGQQGKFRTVIKELMPERVQS